MRRATGTLAIFSMLLLLGVGNLFRYSEKVRFVDFICGREWGRGFGAACWLDSVLVYSW
jgi:hypothetical protein